MPFRFTTAGESHGPGLTAVLEGLPAGIALTQMTSTATLHAASSAMAAAAG